jgi:hypothetical protein
MTATNVGALDFESITPIVFLDAVLKMERNNFYIED